MPSACSVGDPLCDAQEKCDLTTTTANTTGGLCRATFRCPACPRGFECVATPASQNFAGAIPWCFKKTRCDPPCAADEDCETYEGESDKLFVPPTVSKGRARRPACFLQLRPQPRSPRAAQARAARARPARHANPLGLRCQRALRPCFQPASQGRPNARQPTLTRAPPAPPWLAHTGVKKTGGGGGGGGGSGGIP